MSLKQFYKPVSNVEAIPEESKSFHGKIKSIEEKSKSSRLAISSPFHFRPNVDFSSEGNTQPEELRIDVYTESGSEEFRLSDVFTMFIELTTSSPTSDEVLCRAKAFLDRLSGRTWTADQLEISGFPIGYWFRALVCGLSPKSLYLTCPLSLELTFFSKCLPRIEALDLKFEENSDLQYFTQLPSSLEHLSLEFSSLINNSQPLSISNCTKLETL
jgi:hypothetical protein